MSTFFLYSTRGQWTGLLLDGYLYNPQGEWIGWVERDGQVYSVAGEYVGWLTRDFRVLRKRGLDAAPHLRRRPPARPPERVALPASVPLPPLFGETGFDTLDVFDEAPERLHTLDADPAAKDIGG
jgi:hypothetical protein